MKGWKETQDLPAEAVVADYNDYIEKLPKAVRPGVSDVKYYVDDAGRNAVAVLVNVGDTQWTHLLVYDKQNKRNSALIQVFAARAQESFCSKRVGHGERAILENLVATHQKGKNLKFQRGIFGDSAKLVWEAAQPSF